MDDVDLGPQHFLPVYWKGAAMMSGSAPFTQSRDVLTIWTVIQDNAETACNSGGLLVRVIPIW